MAVSRPRRRTGCEVPCAPNEIRDATRTHDGRPRQAAGWVTCGITPANRTPAAVGIIPVRINDTAKVQCAIILLLLYVQRVRQHYYRVANRVYCAETFNFIIFFLRPSARPRFRLTARGSHVNRYRTPFVRAACARRPFNTRGASSGAD